MTRAAAYRALAAASLVALIFVCLAWEAWGAPLRAGGTWMMLKTLPLLAPLRGVLAGRRYTHQWAMMLVLAYFVEGVTRGYADEPPSRYYAWAETALAVFFFAAAMLYLRAGASAPASGGRSRGSAK